jgi:hypothetical protein
MAYQVSLAVATILLSAYFALNPELHSVYRAIAGVVIALNLVQIGVAVIDYWRASSSGETPSPR